ncbi:hypothetical protein EIP91_002790 [Steccherinum ochraceum]|uniref:Uncharacterized protein n=1 Tax=Steccherinum ochraceum TaxID=92696 RepID=A0A4R0RBK7_9APHY|nr:hypothetical protein EIP91_002790 [Steccherinum ochraceum]
MCEDSSPVQALAYLQTEVSSVVDHSDPEEAKVFRSLLSHLLTPTSKSTSASSTPPQDDADTQKRKRSIPDSVGDLADEDEVMVELSDASADELEESPPVVSFQRDPDESTWAGNRPSPNPERYKQRTEVFENLMKFVNEDARQPVQNLWDMIDVDHLGGRQ